MGLGPAGLALRAELTPRGGGGELPPTIQLLLSRAAARRWRRCWTAATFPHSAVRLGFLLKRYLRVPIPKSPAAQLQLLPAGPSVLSHPLPVLGSRATGRGARGSAAWGPGSDRRAVASCPCVAGSEVPCFRDLTCWVSAVSSWHCPPGDVSQCVPCGVQRPGRDGCLVSHGVRGEETGPLCSSEGAPV